MMIQARDEERGTVLELNGSFGPLEEERLNSVLRALDPETPVTIDFRAVRLFHDIAVARLARDICELHRRVSLIGLSEHHHRLLRYIGLATA
jgi:hypothetical protein